MCADVCFRREAAAYGRRKIKLKPKFQLECPQCDRRGDWLDSASALKSLVDKSNSQPSAAVPQLWRRLAHDDLFFVCAVSSAGNLKIVSTQQDQAGALRLAQVMTTAPEDILSSQPAGASACIGIPKILTSRTAA